MTKLTLTAPLTVTLPEGTVLEGIFDHEQPAPEPEPPSLPPIDVALGGGQSGKVPREANDGGAGFPSNVYQIDQTSLSLIPAVWPLSPAASGTPSGRTKSNLPVGGICPFVQFAIEWAERPENASRSLVIGNVAVGGSGHDTGRWQKGGDLYQQLVDVTAAIAGPYRMLGLLWQQAGGDMLNGVPAATWKSYTQQFFADLRSDLARPNLPIVLTPMADEMAADNPTIAPSYQAALAEIVAADPLVSVIANAGMFAPIDRKHYDAPSRRIQGSRLLAKLIP